MGKRRKRNETDGNDKKLIGQYRHQLERGRKANERTLLHNNLSKFSLFIFMFLKLFFFFGEKSLFL
jgi:hypothetical protein